MYRYLWPVLLCLPLLAALPGLQSADTDDGEWKDAMRRVHARFTGRPGTLALFGDSITVTQAFWAPLRFPSRNVPPEMERALRLVRAELKPECWQEWKGPEYGSEGTQTIRWADANLDRWLEALNPEVALIMFGTNDLHSVELSEYRDKLRSVVDRCLRRGTVVILSTIPPRHGFEEKARVYSEAIRQVARELKVPLTDYYAEVLKRRPDDWDGALERFSAYEGYEVPTLISRDGVHPSYPKQYQNDYSPEGLSRSGYTLRNYLSVLKVAEVLQAIRQAKETEPKPAGTPAVTDLLSQPWYPKAPPLPPPPGPVVRASTADELYQAVAEVKPGGTVLLADGRYPLSRPLELKTDRVALRGASGDRSRVVLDARGEGEAVWITACSGVTIADLTVENARWNGIKLNSETSVQRVTLHNLVLHNIWQRAVKGVIVPPQDRDRIRPSDCRVQFCLFYNDRPKRFADDATDTPQTFDGNYIGGIDVMYARRWVISDNVFVGIQGRTRGARGAIFLWQDTRDAVVERNIIIDCDSGICLGNSHRGEPDQIHCTRVVVRNNFVTRAPENGILADYTRDCRILHNTVHDPGNRLGRLIRVVHDAEGLVVANNLLSGPPLRRETESRITLRGNLESDLTAALADPASGDLHLTPRASEAIDRAAPEADVREDIDRQPRGATPDIGADELVPDALAR